MAGVLRIHFTRQDLLLMQLAGQSDPMWEAVLGTHVLVAPAGRLTPRLSAWKANARRKIDPEVRSACRLLMDLAPADASYFPDFLTPIEAMEGLDTGLDALRSTPRSRIRHELGFASKRRALPNWTCSLARGEGEAMQDVARSFQIINDRLIRPDWTQVAAALEMDRSERLSALERSFSSLLDSMYPFTWNDPVLSAPYPMDWDIRLGGRGICFIPSYFCDRSPVAIVDPKLPPVVVYPLQVASRRTAHDEALGALLGDNRAKVLVSLRTASTTGDIAAMAGLRPSVVSGHLKILRNAGLVESERQGQHVLHTLTPRGAVLTTENNPG